MPPPKLVLAGEPKIPLTGDPMSYSLEKIKEEGLKGCCLCGSINITLRDPTMFDEPRSINCHCWNCRKVAGSTMSSNLILEKSQVTIEDKNGTLKYWEDKWTESGIVLKRYFCSTCGKLVFLYPPRLF
jgi:hypothetical protein